MADSHETPLDRPPLLPPSRGRGLWLSLAAALAVAVVAYTGWWFWLAGAAKDRVAAWAEAERADGRTVEMTGPAIDGFPLRVAVALSDIRITDAAAGWRVRLPALDAAFAPWRIDRIEGRLRGPLALGVEGGPAAGAYALSAADNHFRVLGGRLPEIAATFTAPVLSGPGAGAVLRAAALDLTLARGSNPVFGSALVAARDVTLPDGTGSPFGSRVARLEGHVDLLGATPPEGPVADALRAWSADGGTLEIRGLELDHGVLGLAGEGTVSVDGDLQPIGAFSVRIAGFNAAVDRLVDAGAVRREDGALAKLVLGVLAKSPDGGGRKVVEAPLTIQDRTLYVGPIPLVRLKRIAWE